MTMGSVNPFTITMTSGSTLTSAMDLGGGYNKTMLGIPTMTSGTDVRLRTSDQLDGTYRPIYLEPVAGTTTPPLLNIASSVSNCYIPINIASRYLKVEHTTATTASAHEYKVICNAN